MPVIVRQLVASDLPNGVFETLGNLTSSPQLDQVLATSILQRMNAQGAIVFAAIDGNQVVGLTTLLIEDKLIGGGVRCGHVEDVATRRGFEGHGIGRKVVQAAVEHAQMCGCYKVVLSCSEQNVPFYTKLSFMRRGSEMIIKF